MEKETRGCAVILTIGLIAGTITGIVLGINIAAWNFASIIAEGYAEVIHTEGDAKFISEHGQLYKLVKVGDDLRAIEEHNHTEK